MKQKLILLACTTMCALLGTALMSVALCTCENQQVIAILKDASELDYLQVVAYAGDFPIQGGVSMQPSFTKSVFDYRVYVASDTSAFSIHAGMNASGTINIYSEQDQMSGNDFDFFGEPKTITLTVQRDYMEAGEYRLTVELLDTVPLAKNIKVTVEPGVAAFFIGSGVLPEFTVRADLPLVNGEPTGNLSYQWFVNSENSTMGGSTLYGQTGITYRMPENETKIARTIYYYVEITNNIGGETGTTVSAPCAVTFINKGVLDERSVAMADIPEGWVMSAKWLEPYNINSWLDYSWNTRGFSMGRNLVAWELWETVWKHAEATNYGFARKGNQGGRADPYNTNLSPQPIGNRLHPVTTISWRDAAVWCNAYSEMEGLEPVYRDKNTGQPLRDSRDAVELLLDLGNMDWNGYRLPTIEELGYVTRGANSSGEAWAYRFPGTDNENELDQYLWGYSPERWGMEGMQQTGEIGSLMPNQIWNGSQYVDGLYDLAGMVYHWVDWPREWEHRDWEESFYLGTDFKDRIIGQGILSRSVEGFGQPYDSANYYVGLRVARSKL